MPTTGFIGLGARGSRTAPRLIAAGNQVYGTNRTAEKAQPLIDRGLVWEASPREVAAAAEISFSMVTDDDALAAIARGPGGILAGLGPGKVYVDMSTVSPKTSRELSAQVSELGARMLDAPVSGSLPQAEAGTLAIMVGGEGEAFALVEPLHKDIRLACQTASELATPLPSATVVEAILNRASELGYAHRDLAALHEVLAKQKTRP